MKQLKKQAAGIETPYSNNDQKSGQEQEENTLHVSGGFSIAILNLPVCDHNFNANTSDLLPSDHTGGLLRPPCKA
ncbi:MAG: hypothetical protein ACXVPA_05310 [Bacteroidia bacterium]